MINLELYKMLKTSEGEMPLDVELQIENGELVAIEGHSGAGKTTILRMLAGLLNPEMGRIEVENNIWVNTKKKLFLVPQKREVGFVFQDYSLFPNMTVQQNIEYALGKKEDMQRVREIIEIMELDELKKRFPETLSGGQKQRAALARAIVRKPKILLLDEPLSALDNEMRIKLQDYILKVHRNLNLTTILVTHDIPEIFKMSDRVVRLSKGKIVGDGNVSNVFKENYISGKFKFVGEVLKIEKDEIVYIVSVLIGKNIVKVIATEDEVKELQINDKVMIVSKAFNPLLIKINS
jgi:molybdate transport system ATP-binding protein